MFLFFLHNHKSCLLLSVCLTGRNLGRLFQDGVCNVLSVLFDYRCKRKVPYWLFASSFFLFFFFFTSETQLLRQTSKSRKLFYTMKHWSTQGLGRLSSALSTAWIKPCTWLKYVLQCLPVINTDSSAARWTKHLCMMTEWVVVLSMVGRQHSCVDEAHVRAVSRRSIDPSQTRLRYRRRRRHRQTPRSQN